MRIGELARMAEVTTDTIRYYERIGLLQPPERTASGYRNYSLETLDDLTFVKKAQASGLKLDDVREVMRISAGGVAPCDHVKATVTQRLQEVEGRLAELRALRAKLRATLASLDTAPEPTTECRCAAIELTAARG
ncbi:MAG: heavy metal-responsive transcriptional regulator [Gemmatimonadales bacterium]